MEKLSNEQLQILGESIGRGLGKQLWQEAQASNPRKQVMGALEYACDTIGIAAGRIIADKIKIGSRFGS